MLYWFEWLNSAAEKSILMGQARTKYNRVFNSVNYLGIGINLRSLNGPSTGLHTIQNKLTTSNTKKYRINARIEYRGSQGV